MINVEIKEGAGSGLQTNEKEHRIFCPCCKNVVFYVSLSPLSCKNCLNVLPDITRMLKPAENEIRLRYHVFGETSYTALNTCK